MPQFDPSLVVLVLGGSVLAYVGYQVYTNENPDPQDPSPPPEADGSSDTKTQCVDPGRHPKARLHLGVSKLRETKGAHAWANAASQVFYP